MANDEYLKNPSWPAQMVRSCSVKKWCIWDDSSNHHLKHWTCDVQNGNPMQPGFTMLHWGSGRDPDFALAASPQWQAGWSTHPFPCLAVFNTSNGRSFDPTGWYPKLAGLWMVGPPNRVSYILVVPRKKHPFSRMSPYNHPFWVSPFMETPNYVSHLWAHLADPWTQPGLVTHRPAFPAEDPILQQCKGANCVIKRKGLDGNIVAPKDNLNHPKLEM